jgi:hypothetical protein
VKSEDVIGWLETKGISPETATMYATKILAAEFTTLRMLATLTKEELEKLEFALGHQAVVIQTFQEQSEELSSAVSGSYLTHPTTTTTHPARCTFLFGPSVLAFFASISRNR